MCVAARSFISRSFISRPFISIIQVISDLFVSIFHECLSCSSHSSTFSILLISLCVTNVPPPPLPSFPSLFGLISMFYFFLANATHCVYIHCHLSPMAAQLFDTVNDIYNKHLDASLCCRRWVEEGYWGTQYRDQLKREKKSSSSSSSSVFFKYTTYSYFLRHTHKTKVQL